MRSHTTSVDPYEYILYVFHEEARIYFVNLPWSSFSLAPYFMPFCFGLHPDLKIYLIIQKFTKSNLSFLYFPYRQKTVDNWRTSGLWSTFRMFRTLPANVWTGMCGVMTQLRPSSENTLYSGRYAVSNLRAIRGLWCFHIPANFVSRSLQGCSC